MEFTLFTRSSLAVLAGCALLAAPAAEAATYSFNRTVGTNGSVSGFFTTDGTIGALTTANITDFSLTIEDDGLNGGTPITASSAGGQALGLFSGEDGDLVATATDILFNFDGDASFFANMTNDFLGDFWCIVGARNGGGCFFDGAEVIGNVAAGLADPNSVVRTGYTGLTSIASVAVTPIPVPAGMTLLLTAMGGLALARRRKARAVA